MKSKGDSVMDIKYVVCDDRDGSLLFNKVFNTSAQASNAIYGKFKDDIIAKRPLAEMAIEYGTIDISADIDVLSKPYYIQQVETA